MTDIVYAHPNWDPTIPFTSELLSALSKFSGNNYKPLTTVLNEMHRLPFDYATIPDLDVYPNQLHLKRLLKKVFQDIDKYIEYNPDVR